MFRGMGKPKNGDIDLNVGGTSCMPTSIILRSSMRNQRHSPSAIKQMGSFIGRRITEDSQGLRAQKLYYLLLKQLGSFSRALPHLPVLCVPFRNA